jgi:hypothetical protein
MTEAELLIERLRDAYAVLRSVPAMEGEDALVRHGRIYDPETGTGTRDGLADSMLDAIAYIKGLNK